MQLPICAFNFNDQFDLQGIVSGANRARASAVLMISARAAEFSGLEYLRSLFSAARKEASSRLFLQLDHCREVSAIESAVEMGFDLVMADFSHLPPMENVKATREAVRLGRRRGVLVEGQVTPIPEAGEWDELAGPLTDVEEAREFVAATGVDLLSVSVGNCHGAAPTKPVVDFSLIRELHAALPVPLVLHGSDFLSDYSLQEAVRSGIGKINLGPELRVAYRFGLEEGIRESEDTTDHRPIVKQARSRVSEAVYSRLVAIASGAVT